MGLLVEKLKLRRPHFEIEASFEVAPGGRVALMGPSGSGKTTLFRMLAGLEVPESGSIALDGRDLTHLAPEARDVGVVFQDHALFPMLNVLDNVTFGLRMRGISAREREEQALPMLRKLGLESRSRCSVDILSGGERGRVAFARALLPKPKFLLLDEPFAALDVALRSSLRRELLSLHAEHPVPLLLVTHDEDDAREVATARLMLDVSSDGSRRTIALA